MKFKRKFLRLFIAITLFVVALGLLIPQNLKMPVEGATKADYNPKSFWYYPWGQSVTHKGVDIFAEKGTNLHPATNGLVLFSGNFKMGGKVILILGPKWRIHYYAHLDEVSTTFLSFHLKKDVIGKVGDSGNAKGKSPHLHYSIFSLVPYPWKIDSSKQGWKKMFFLNPIEYIESGEVH